MTLREALRQATEQLTAAQVPSATTAEVLLLHVLGCDRAFLYAHSETELTAKQEQAYRKLLEERAAGTPTQYLTGRQEFWGLELHIDRGVFIPRPETEHVVEVSLKVVREHLAEPHARLVDVGTGTGAIALALARELPEAEVVATDVSPAALALARANAQVLGLADRIQFVEGDLLEPFFGHDAMSAAFDFRSFDLVVSNPPYVSPEEAAQLPREVREHEPAAALYSPEEGLAVTRRLIDQARVALGRNGWLVLELGHDMAARVRALLGENWTGVDITNDLAGIPRVLAAQKSS